MRVEWIKKTKDDKETVKWYRKAAEKVYAYAQFCLGDSYDRGDEVVTDPVKDLIDEIKAVKWYRMAAEQGEAVAQNNLGLMYDEGQGVPQDYAEAYVWFSVAAAGGDAKAVKGRDLAASELTPDQLSQGQKRATELLEKISGGK